LTISLAPRREYRVLQLDRTPGIELTGELGEAVAIEVELRDPSPVHVAKPVREEVGAPGPRLVVPCGLAPRAARGVREACFGGYGRCAVQLGKARERLLDLPELVEVDLPDPAALVDLVDGDHGDLERAAVARAHPSADDHAPVVGHPDVVQAETNVRCEIHEHPQGLDPCRRGPEGSPPDQPVVVGDEGGRAARHQPVPIAGGDEASERREPRGRVGVLRRFAGGVARVELGVGGVEVGGVEADQDARRAERIQRADVQEFDLARADVVARDLDARADERETIAAGGE
jgi:hypothetical protein